MGVYIEGMEMPISCGVCRFAGSCGVHNAEEWPDLESIMFNDVIGIGGVRDPNCPLVPVPPHGRLGDLDELKERVTKRLYASNHGSMAEAYYAALIDLIDTAPTIIPAEEENSNVE